MKEITLILDDGYDDVVSVTAIGHCGSITNVTNNVYKAIDGEVLHFPYDVKPSQLKQDEKE